MPTARAASDRHRGQRGQRSISGLTVTGGVSDTLVNPGNGDSFNGDGGGILAVGPLTLTDVTVRGNRAALGGGGIFAEPIEDILGPDSSMPLVLIRTTVTGNKVDSAAPGNGQGGGVAAFGDLAATNSTIHANSVTKDGVNEGGGIVSTNGFTDLLNTTITGNSVDSPASFAGGVTSTISGSRRSIGAQGHQHDRRGQHRMPDAVGLRRGRPPGLTDNNISGDDSCEFDDPGSKEDTNPQLGGLGNNAGHTDTLKFAHGSAALQRRRGGRLPGHRPARPKPAPAGHLRHRRGGAGAAHAVTGGVTGLTAPSATILGTSVNPLSWPARPSFEFGTSTAYGPACSPAGPRLRRGERGGGGDVRRRGRSHGLRHTATTTGRSPRTATGSPGARSHLHTRPRPGGDAGAPEGVGRGCAPELRPPRIHAARPGECVERHPAEGGAGHARRPHDQAHHAAELHGARQRAAALVRPPHAPDQGGGSRQPHAHGHPQIPPLRTGARRRAALHRLTRLRDVAKKERKAAAGDVATNRQASYRYNLLEKWEAGMELMGSEVKSIRNGGVQIKDAYAALEKGEVWLHNMHIAPYDPASREGHDPERPRKLLLHRKEIERLIGKTRRRGYAGAHARLLQGLAREGRDRARQGQGPRGQAPRPQGQGPEARDRSRAAEHGR